MKKTLLAIALLATVATAAPAPYPITINSRNQTAPNVVVYQGNEMSFRASFKDGSTASDITGATPFMNWATNSLASGMSTSSWQVVGAVTGLVDFTFSPQALNFTPGRYMYEVGLINDDVPSVYRQGVFQINGSPQGSGAAAVVFVDDVDWSLIGNYYNTSTDGPYLFGSGFTYTTNATGQLLLTATGGGSCTNDLQAVTENGGTTTEQVTIDAANAHTNTYGGMLGIGAARWQDSVGTATAAFSHADSLGQASGISSHADSGGNASGSGSHADSGGNASGSGSHASGEAAVAAHDFSWVASDGTATTSTTTKQATLHFDNGIRLLGAAGVEIEGTNTAAAFVGDGSGLTGIDASPWTDNGDDTITYNGDGMNMTNANGDVFSVNAVGDITAGGDVNVDTIRPASGDNTQIDFSAANNLDIRVTNYAFVDMFVNDGIIFNESGRDLNDFRVESDTDTHALFVDAGLDMIGFGTATPLCKVDVAGAIASGTAAFTTAGPTDNLDVSGINKLQIDASGGNVTIGGLAGGVDGQQLTIAMNSTNGTATIENEEGGATQAIYLSTAGDETLTRGGWLLECNGTDWREVAAKGPENADFALYYEDGSIEYLNAAGLGEYNIFGYADPVMVANDCTVYQLRDYVKDSEFTISGTNFTFNGLGNQITCYMTNALYNGNVGFRARSCIDARFENVKLRLVIDSPDVSYTNLTFNPYTVACGSSGHVTSNYVFSACDFQMEYMLDAPTDPDGDFIKAIVDTELHGESTFNDCTFIVLCPNSTNELVNYTATHGATGRLTLKDTRFITSRNLSKLLVNEGGDNTDISTCSGNMQYDYTGNRNRDFSGMTDEEAKSYLFLGTDSLWADDESDRPPRPDVVTLDYASTNWVWNSVSGWIGVSGASVGAPSGIYQVTLPPSGSPFVTAGASVPAGEFGNAQCVLTLDLPASTNASPAEYVFNPSMRLAELSGTTPLVRSFPTTTVINSTGAQLLTNVVISLTDGVVTSDVTTFTVSRVFGSEANTTGNDVKLWAARLRTY